MNKPALEKTIAMVDQLGRIYGEMPVPLDGTDKQRLAVGMLDAALEHYRAIVRLVDHDLYGSAFALLRVQFEAYITSLWLYHCATNKQVVRFNKGKSADVDMATMVAEVEKVDGFQGNVLSSMHKQSWKTMNSYTHTGMLQISRRYTSTDIGGNYSTEEISEVLECSESWAKMCVLQLTILANNQARLDLIQDLILSTSKLSTVAKN